MNKIVFDIETQNSFEDVGGRQNLQNLSVSVVGTYSYMKNEYRCFSENELDELGEFLRCADLLIGFSSKRFDIPVLKKYFNFNIAAIPHYDILDEIESALGRRISLGHLAHANLGVGKTGHGMEAINFYRKGEMEALKQYCLQDVKITKEIYDLIRKQGYLWIPDKRRPQMTKLTLHVREPERSAQGKLI